MMMSKTEKKVTENDLMPLEQYSKNRKQRNRKNKCPTKPWSI